MKNAFLVKAGVTALLAVLTLVGCGEANPTPKPSEPSDTTVVEPVKTYTVKWQVEGKVVETDTDVKENSMPTYDGATPTKEGDAQYSYSFEGWEPALSAVTKDITYTAKFSRTVNKYTVKFDTQEGSEIAPVTVEYGSKVNEPETKPTKEGYRFVGWAYDKAGKEKVTFPIEVKENKTVYAIWNESLPIMTYLQSLLDGYNVSPMSFIPEAMLPSNEANLINKNTNYDFSKSVDISKVNYYGYGKQWNMIMDNLIQSQKIFKYLSIVETISDASITAFNNYFDKNPADSATHTTKVGTYDVTIKYENNLMAYVLSFTVGEQVAEIWLNLNVETNERACRIQIGDANALKFISTNDKYEFALRLAGVRRSYFKVERKDGKIYGQINEHTGVDGKLDLTSAALFTIDNNYVYAFGNKADAKLASKPFVTELYDVKTGRFVGLELRETLLKKDYDTYWFNLSDQTGINAVQNFEKQPTEEGQLPTYEVRVNGSDKEFKVGHMGGLDFSRKYRIEFIDRYNTYKDVDEDNKTVYMMKEFNIPMLGVQEAGLDSFEKDLNKNNKGLDFNFNLSKAKIDVLTNAYHNNQESFEAIKEAVSQQAILDFIGQKFLTK